MVVIIAMCCPWSMILNEYESFYLILESSWARKWVYIVNYLRACLLNHHRHSRTPLYWSFTVIKIHCFQTSSNKILRNHSVQTIFTALLFWWFSLWRVNQTNEILIASLRPKQEFLQDWLVCYLCWWYEMLSYHSRELTIATRRYKLSPLAG